MTDPDGGLDCPTPEAGWGEDARQVRVADLVEGDEFEWAGLAVRLLDWYYDKHSQKNGPARRLRIRIIKSGVEHDVHYWDRETVRWLPSSGGDAR